MTTVTVTLDQTTSPWTLDVNQQQVSVATYPSTITWELSGMPSGAAWPTDYQDHPPFKWVNDNNEPPPGTFTQPSISGVNLSATDNGSTGTNKGPWPYQLCIQIGTNYYYTSNSPSIAFRVGKAPTIKNT